MATLNTGSAPSANPIVDGQIIWAEHVTRIISALNGDAQNEIIINDSLSQGALSNLTDNSTSHAQGIGVNASGLYSHAEGNGTISSGTGSHAEGSGSTASGNYSSAEGNTTLASALYAKSIGNSTVASGQSSFAAGVGTIANGVGQVAIGTYNVSNTTDLFVVGSGSSGGARATAFGINSSSTYVSNSLLLPTLTTDSQTSLLTYNSTTKQVFYTSSAAIVPGNALITASIANGVITFTKGDSSTFPITINTGSFSGSFTGELIGTASWALSASFITASNVYGPFGSNSVISASYALTASFTPGAGSVGSSLTQGTGVTSFSYNGSSPQTVAVSGASTLSTNAITKWTGNAFANSSLTDDGTTVTGNTSIQLTGANSSLTGSLFGTSSWALSASFVTGSNVYGPFGSNSVISASYALTASFTPGAGSVGSSLTQGTGITVFSYNGGSAQTVAVSGASTLNANAITKWTGNAFANSSLTDNGTTVTGNTSIQLTGVNSSLTGSFSGSFTGSLNGTAATASFVPTLKAGAVADTSFTQPGGTDNYQAVVAFASVYSNNDYAVTVTGEDARSWTIESKTGNGFTINSNSTTPLTGEVYWITTPYNN
jgi:hypothetical protein